MANALTGSYGFNNVNVTLLTDLNATREAILTAISMTAGAGEVACFYSGHGMNDNAEDGDKERTNEAIVAHDGENPESDIFPPLKFILHWKELLLDISHPMSLELNRIVSCCEG